MTKDEFIAFYCQRSGIEWTELSKWRVALRCTCGDNGCHGWAMVHNDADSIRDHNELYAPKGLAEPSIDGDNFSAA